MLLAYIVTPEESMKMLSKGKITVGQHIKNCVKYGVSETKKKKEVKKKG